MADRRGLVPPIVGSSFVTLTSGCSTPSICDIWREATFPDSPGWTAVMGTDSTRPIPAGRSTSKLVWNRTPRGVLTMVPLGTTTGLSLRLASDRGAGAPRLLTAKAGRRRAILDLKLQLDSPGVGLRRVGGPFLGLLFDLDLGDPRDRLGARGQSDRRGGEKHVRAGVTPSTSSANSSHGTSAGRTPAGSASSGSLGVAALAQLLLVLVDRPKDSEARCLGGHPNRRDLADDGDSDAESVGVAAEQPHGHVPAERLILRRDDQREGLVGRRGKARADGEDVILLVGDQKRRHSVPCARRRQDSGAASRADARAAS